MRRKKVLVVGAGMAGLSAAYQLALMEHDVTVLEARKGPGGKVRTIRAPLSKGLYVEAGAFVIPPSHALTRYYADELELDLEPFTRTVNRQPHMFHLRNTTVNNPNDDTAAWPLPLGQIEGTANFLTLYDKYLHVPGDVGDPRDGNWPSGAAQRYDRMTFAQYLREQGASEEAIAVLRLYFLDIWGDGIDVCSALFHLQDMAVQPLGPDGKLPAPPAPGTKSSFVRGGNDRLPRALARSAQLRGRVRYDTPVIAIEATEKRVKVVSAEGRGYSADYVIVTVPFSVLRGMQLRIPNLSAGKRRAIAQLQYTSVTRIWLQTTSRFWETAGLAGCAHTDLPVMFVQTPSTWLKCEKGVIEAYVTGRQARAMQALGPKGRVRAMVEEIEKIYPGVAPEVERATSICWDEDPWAQGDYPWWMPGDYLDFGKDIATPEGWGRVHFAGEHTSMLPGWMQGALESGHRAARDVNDAV
jgi:monoamine oxidase